MSDLSFSRPEFWPLLFLAVPAWIMLFWSLRGRHNARTGYGAPLTERLPGPAARASRLILAMVLLFVAYLEPRLGHEQIQVERRGLDLVFALDTSRSPARPAAPARPASSTAQPPIRQLRPSLFSP